MMMNECASRDVHFPRQPGPAVSLLQFCCVSFSGGARGRDCDRQHATQRTQTRRRLKSSSTTDTWASGLANLPRHMWCRILNLACDGQPDSPEDWPQSVDEPVQEVCHSLFAWPANPGCLRQGRRLSPPPSRRRRPDCDSSRLPRFVCCSGHGVPGWLPLTPPAANQMSCG